MEGSRGGSRGGGVGGGGRGDRLPILDTNRFFF